MQVYNTRCLSGEINTFPDFDISPLRKAQKKCPKVTNLTSKAISASKNNEDCLDRAGPYDNIQG